MTNWLSVSLSVCFDHDSPVGIDMLIVSDLEVLARIVGSIWLGQFTTQQLFDIAV